MLPSRSLRTATQIAVPGRNAVATVERRDMSPVGVARRKRFDDSLDLLRALGLSSTAVEHYRLLARIPARCRINWSARWPNTRLGTQIC